MRQVGQSALWQGRIEKLRELYAEGLSATEIARELNDHPEVFFATRNAVIGKLHRLGLNRGRKSRKAGAVSLPRPVRTKRFIFGNGPPKAPSIPLPVLSEPIGNHPYRCGIHDLRNDTCRWPVGQPGHKDFFFCGSPTADLADRRPYCAPHQRLGWYRPWR